MGFVMALYLNLEGKDYIGKGKVQQLEFVSPSPSYLHSKTIIFYK